MKALLGCLLTIAAIIGVCLMIGGSVLYIVTYLWEIIIAGLAVFGLIQLVKFIKNRKK